MTARTPEQREAWTHRTAVVFIPPVEVWPPIQAIRRSRDRQFERWMPHVTLLYPFAPRFELASHLPALTTATAGVPTFEATLDRFHAFKHRGSNSTLWLAPEPREAFIHLQAVLQRAAPAFDQTARHAGGFTPHLSVGQASSETETHAALEALSAGWTPLTFPVSEVQIIAREGDRPFEVVHVLRLGAPSPETF